MNDILDSRWRISEGCEILHRRFGDQYAIFHRCSGDTHLLDDISFLVLEELNGGVRSYEQLLEKLTAEVEFESKEQSDEYLNTLLTEFQKLTIVERFDT